MGRRRIESRFVLPAFSPAPGHFVVDLQNRVLRPVTAVLLLVLTLHNWERLHNVVNVVAFYAVEVEVEGVEFGSEPEAAICVPPRGQGGSIWRSEERRGGRECSLGLTD